jgi:glycogen synthase
MGLQEGADIPLVGMVGRLSSQRGWIWSRRVLDGVMATGCQLVVLGMGEDRYVDLSTGPSGSTPGASPPGSR